MKIFSPPPITSFGGRAEGSRDGPPERAVLGTECLDSMYQFNQKQARIVAGREFTDEEYESGSRVCVISEALAGNSGLSLGDTITMSQFGYDPFLSRYNYGMITSYQGKLINPLPTAYSELLAF